MKKIFLFIIGFFLIPTILGSATAYLYNPENYETYIGYWGSIYLLIYIIFPLIYQDKITQNINKYTLYALIYLILFLLTILTLIFANT